MIVFALILFIGTNVFAGTAQSNGGSYSGGSGGGSSESFWKMGSFYSRGCKWDYFNGSKDIYYTLPYTSQYGCSYVNAVEIKGANMQKSCSTTCTFSLYSIIH